MCYVLVCVLYIVISCIVIVVLFSVFFFKQKTAYEMRISDWSSDVCSSDLKVRPVAGAVPARKDPFQEAAESVVRFENVERYVREIGRASCRERVCQYV